MEIIFSEYGFAIWETMYALVLEVVLLKTQQLISK